MAVFTRRRYAYIALLWLIGWSLLVWPRVSAPGRFAYDYEIYRDGTRDFFEGRPLYKPDGERSPFTAFNGPPSTALVYAPFAFGSFTTSLFWYRVGLSVLFAVAVIAASASLPRHRRPLAWAVGAAALIFWHPVFSSMVLGQLDAWVVAALALAVFLASRDRWFGAGACLGIGALLKVSPVLTLVYCVIDRRWRALGGAIVVLAGAVFLTTLIGPLTSWLFFATHIAPDLPKEAMQLDNQSLPAVLARVLTSRQREDGLGLWSLLALPTAVGGLALVWSAARGAYFRPFALSLVILVGLLAGPITWDHYETWALVPLILGLDERLWAAVPLRKRPYLWLLYFVGAGLFVIQFSPRPSGLVRVASQLGTLGLALQLGVGLTLMRAKSREAETLELDDRPRPA